MNNFPKEFINESVNKKELTGLSKALQDYKKEVLHLQNLPMSADCLMESIQAERTFRKVITDDIRELVEINCASCPLGYEKDTCEAKQCPFKTISEILNSRLKQLSNILPGFSNE